MLKIIPFADIAHVSSIFDRRINRFDVALFNKEFRCIGMALGIAEDGVQVALNEDQQLRAAMTPDALGEFMQALGWCKAAASGDCQPYEFKLDLASMMIRQMRFVLLTNIETAETKKTACIKMSNDETRYYIKNFADSVLHITTSADDAMELTDASRECLNDIIDREMLDAETVTARQIKQGMDDLISSILDEGRTLQ